MTRRELFGVSAMGVLSLTLAGSFVCLPVFADNPVNISIVEEVDDGSGSLKQWEDITGAMPGDVYSAIPRIENNGSVLVAVRMCLLGVMTNYAGETMDLPSNAFGINIGENWTLDNEDVADPTDPASGNCYKYNAMLEPGSKTEPLFYEVLLNPMFTNEHQGATFTLHLDAFAADDSSDESVTPSGSDAPDTGMVTGVTSGAAFVIPYVLGAAALMVLMAHLIRGLFWKKNEGRVKQRGRK